VQQVYRNAALVGLRRREVAAQQGLPEAAAAYDGSAALRLLELGRSRGLADLMAAPDPGLPAALVDARRGASAEVALCQVLLAAEPADPARVTARSAELTAARDELTARHVGVAPASQVVGPADRRLPEGAPAHVSTGRRRSIVVSDPPNRFGVTRT
jgi:hypothetical protein